MSAGNFVTEVGNLTRDPELKYTPNGAAVVDLGMAVNRRWKKEGSEDWQEETSFFNVSAWGTLAENVGSSLVKGDRVIIVGELRQRSWETDDGEKRSVVEIKASHVGPDLTWAEASITKNEKRTGGGGQRPPHPADSNEEPF